MRALYAFQPVLFAVAQVLAYLVANLDSFDLASAARSLTIAACSALILWALLLWPLRDARKSAFVTSLAAVLFWSSSSVLSELSAVPLLGTAMNGLLWFVVLPLVAVLLARTRRNLTTLYRVSTVAGLGGVLVPLTSLALDEYPMPLMPPEITGNASSELPKQLPDIYIIVLDAYGRDDELKEYFGLDEGLGSRLRELGFYVAHQSSSNYPTTVHSIPSFLNAGYIQKFLSRPTTDQLTELLHKSRIVAALKRRGYRLIVYASGYPRTELRGADEFIEPPAPQEILGVKLRLSTFEHGLLPWSPFDSWIRSDPKLSPYTEHRERILHALADISRHATNPNPTLVFLHVLSPHEPFVFGEDGRDVSRKRLEYKLNRIYRDPEQPTEPGSVGPEYARRYRAQALYLAERVTAAARDILRRSPEPPIILILSDHGPYGFSPNIRLARFAILHALFLPDGGDKLLYPTISPVNSLRVVMSRYFGTEMPLLPDKRFRTNYAKAHLFEEID